MDGDDVGARRGEGIEEIIDRRDHQMNVEGQGRMGTQRVYHHRADGQIGHEMPVHHVDMDPVGARRLDAAHLFTQLREVGAQDRRGDADGRWIGGHDDRP
jgi:hypothetical protein